MNIKSITGKTSILLISLLLAIPTLNAINAVRSRVSRKTRAG